MQPAVDACPMQVDVALAFQTPAGEHLFCGYYDKSPLDVRNGLMPAVPTASKRVIATK